MPNSFFQSMLSQPGFAETGQYYDSSSGTAYIPEYGTGQYSGQDSYTPGAVTGYRGYSFDPMKDSGRSPESYLGTPFNRFDPSGNQIGSDIWSTSNSGLKGNPLLNPETALPLMLSLPFAAGGLQSLFAGGGNLAGAGAGFAGDTTAVGYDPLFGTAGAGGAGGAAGAAGTGGFAPAASNAAFESALGGNPWSFLDTLKSGAQSLFGSGGSMFGGGASGGGGIAQGALKFGTPLMQILAGLDGRRQAQKLQKQMQLPNPADITGIPGYQAGLEAVQRSMASQGYQGSGNMMAALSKYGGDFYNQYANQRLNSATAQGGPAGAGISSLALLGSGLGGLARAF